jgi:hypothetical protein
MLGVYLNFRDKVYRFHGRNADVCLVVEFDALFDIFSKVHLTGHLKYHVNILCRFI